MAGALLKMRSTEVQLIRCLAGQYWELPRLRGHIFSVGISMWRLKGLLPILEAIKCGERTAVAPIMVRCAAADGRSSRMKSEENNG